MNHSSTPRPPEQQASIDSAMRVVKTIDALLVNDDFRRFIARFTARADQLADEILHDDALSPDEREKRRNHRAGLMEVLLSLKQDREAQIRVLANYGISLGGDQQE